MYMGRIAVEKNIEEFLKLDLPGSKIVIGDGPDLDMLRYKYPKILFTGFKHGQDLAAHLAAADVFVFPSQTDTFGIVLLEAMACGVPIAAFPVAGPIDIVKHGVTGVLCDNLYRAAMDALKLNPGDCVDYAMQYTWKKSAESFLNNLIPIEQSA
jgi:glycosyltransferase involved in cell wall biosynthesis